MTAEWPLRRCRDTTGLFTHRFRIVAQRASHVTAPALSVPPPVATPHSQAVGKGWFRSPPWFPPPLSFYQRLDDHPFIKQDPRNGALESGCPRQARDYQSGMRQTVRHSTLDHDQYSSNHPPRPVFSSLCTMPYILRTSKCRARKLSRSGKFLPSMMSSSAG